MSGHCNPIDHPVCLAVPEQRAVSSWAEHVPFAMWLTSVLRPEVMVELGTYRGTSYCGFCQAISSLKLSTRAFAVDSWQGDPHNGYYGPEVLQELRNYHDHRYGAFSTLLPMTFDEAASRFSDGEIDLLHIDGYHTYEAVRHDFETWQSKVSSRGVILFHDVMERNLDFGVWRLWKELRRSIPASASCMSMVWVCWPWAKTYRSRYEGWSNYAARRPTGSANSSSNWGNECDCRWSWIPPYFSERNSGEAWNTNRDSGSGSKRQWRASAAGNMNSSSSSHRYPGTDSSLPRPRCQGCTVGLEATADLDENCGHRQRFWDAASAPASRARKPAESGDYNSKATGQLGLESQRRGSEMRSVQRAQNKSVRAQVEQQVAEGLRIQQGFAGSELSSWPKVF